MWAGATVIACALCGTVQADVYIAGGDMETGYISEEGDTVPELFSFDPAQRADGNVYIRMDFDTKYEGEASLQIVGETGDYAFWRFGLEDEVSGPGGTYKFGGYVKTDNVGRWVQIEAYRACTGGAWCVMNSVRIMRESGTADWTKFEVDFEMPTEEICEASSCAVKQPSVSCQLQFRGGGTAWLDSLYLCLPPHCEPGTAVEPRALTASRSTSTVSVTPRAVQFEHAARYEVTVLGADGRIVSSTSGFGAEAAFTSEALSSGAYVVRVIADGAASTHMLAVQ